MEIDFDSLHTIEFVKLIKTNNYRALTQAELEDSLPERPYWAQSFYYMKDRLISQVSLNITLQEQIELVKKQNKTIEAYIMCVPEPLDPL